MNTHTSRQLGLVHRVAALISAPGGRLAALIAKVKQVLGPSSKIVSLRQQQQQLPVTNVSSGQQPTTYLQLFQESAARYCPELSWTVLAAIGQIESADGTNNGPSTAGALGPMQFLPSTWAVWGIDGFGRTGPPDIMNPYDAVPSAARMMCADGASAGSSGLASAVFAYNHADLVRERGARPGPGVRRHLRLTVSARGDAPQDPPRALRSGRPPAGRRGWHIPASPQWTYALRRLPARILRWSRGPG